MLFIYSTCTCMRIAICVSLATKGIICYYFFNLPPNLLP